MASPSPVQIKPAWLSPERFAEYLHAAGDDPDLASRLYEWNAHVSAALFEVIHHFEVLLRNSITTQLLTDGQAPNLPPGSPWVQGHKKVQEVEARLRKRNKSVTPGRIYSGLTFGFWQTMFGTEFEELWRHSLQYVFRNSRADRQVIANYLESINQLRNRVAHHGSMVDLDTRVEVQKIIRLAGWIDGDAAQWLRSIERVTTVSAQRPITGGPNVVVVPGAPAWHLYKKLGHSAYIFQAGRSVHLVDHLAFFAENAIQPVVPKILRWFDAVDWNLGNANRLCKSPDEDEQSVGKLIKATKTTPRTWSASVYQVFLLSGPTDDNTCALPAPIAHNQSNPVSVFANSHRYHALAELMSARGTTDLLGQSGR